ncbi:hypothetical protein COO60DRAFT_1462371 [Scenedesmus sp. NREL 46B-D3]|nr:hypothetical protein COO60DRAFT_1462371 [Scenedesmus sp. NREL 46B-D3]
MRAANDALGAGPARLSPCQLLAYLKCRTLWLIGDSHMKHQYYALRCFLLDLWDHSLGECAVSGSAGVEQALWTAADTNHTSVLRNRPPMTDVPKCIHLLDAVKACIESLVNQQQQCLLRPQQLSARIGHAMLRLAQAVGDTVPWFAECAGGRVCFVHSVRGEEFAAAPSAPEAPALLQVLQDSAARPEDIFLVNFGRWHFHNCIGLQTDSYTQSLAHLGSFYQATRARFPNLVFKVSGHDHTECDAAGGMVEPVTRCVPAPQGHYPLSIGRRVMAAAVNVLGRYDVLVMPLRVHAARWVLSSSPSKCVAAAGAARLQVRCDGDEQLPAEPAAVPGAHNLPGRHHGLQPLVRARPERVSDKLSAAVMGGCAVFSWTSGPCTRRSAATPRYSQQQQLSRQAKTTPGGRPAVL